MVLFSDLVHDHRYAFLFLVAVSILLDSTKYLTIWLQVQLVQNEFRYLSFQNKFVVCVKVQLALPLFVFSIVGNLQVVLVCRLELQLLQPFVALLSSQLFAAQLDKVVRRNPNHCDTSKHRGKQSHRPSTLNRTEQVTQPFTCVRRHLN